MVGSCVAVFRSTEGARAFAEEWARRCDSPACKDDEGALVWAYAMRPELRFAHLDQRFAGQEIGVPSQVADIVVWHKAAHHATHWASLRGALRLLERRFFRTGRTKAAANPNLRTN
jgi:hypothetical protein